MTATADLEPRIAELERRVSALEGTRSVRVVSVPGPIEQIPSPREFLLSKSGAKSINDKSVAASYYIEHYEHEEWFDHDGIARVMLAAKERPPKNRRDVAYQNVARGVWREVGPREKGKTAKNRWCLTNTGIALVERNFAKAK